MTTAPHAGPPPGPSLLERNDAAPRSWWNTIGGRQAIAIGVVVVAVVAALVLVPSNVTGASISVSSTPDADSTPTRVERTPRDTTGENPFTASVAATTTTTTLPQATISPGTVAASGLTTQEGSTPGLYGGTRNVASCDSAQLVAFLAANPDKARAFAAVEGITATDIPAYVDGLTSVVLRADTAVTNHGFSNGVATPFQAVLQAGTAVLVDQFGVPRVRCYCGNPLLPPLPAPQSTYTGPSWPGFDPQGVVTVAPAPTPLVVIQIIDVYTGAPIDRSPGPNPRDADPRLPSSTTTTTTTTPGEASASSANPSGTYTLSASQPTFSGTEGLVTKSDCENVNRDKTINVRVAVVGRSIGVLDIGEQPFLGTYDPAAGSFTASRSLVTEVAGASQVQTITGRFDTSGRMTGTIENTVSPPSATCTIPVTGTKA